MIGYIITYFTIGILKTISRIQFLKYLFFGRLLEGKKQYKFNFAYHVLVLDQTKHFLEAKLAQKYDQSSFDSLGLFSYF